MATVSPFRYIQLCRYLFQRLLADQPTIGKGKAKALPSALRRIPEVNSVTYATEATESRRSETSSIAGSSTSSLPPNYHPTSRPLGPDPDLPPEPSEIYRLMNDERLLVKGGVKPPKDVVVLCHGLYGFSTATPIPLFPSLKLHYWASVLEVLRDRMGANVVVVGVKGTGSIKERAEQMHKYLSDTLPKGTGVNFVAHSMGGLDVRHLISNIKPTAYTPISLTTIGTPHRGSPFMDWCAANIGVGSVSAMAAAAAEEAARGLPYSLKSPLLAMRTEQSREDANSSLIGLTGFTSAMSKYLLNIFDSPAYSNLTTAYLREFNSQTSDDPNVKYISVAGRNNKLSVLHPLWFPKLVLDAAAEKGYPKDDSGKSYEGNDGLVSVKSAKWGEFIGAVDDTHHWDLRGEGSIWPSGLSGDSDKKKGDETKESDELVGAPGWDWDDGVHEYLGLNLKGTTDKLGLTKPSSPESSTTQPKGPESVVDVDKEKEAKKDDGGSSLGLGQIGQIAQVAQVGQLLDWVTDVLPGSKSTEAGRQQMQEARDERSAMKKDSKKKEEKQKFDLARFYGGLMLKLKEDGY